MVLDLRLKPHPTPKGRRPFRLEAHRLLEAVVGGPLPALQRESRGTQLSRGRIAESCYEGTCCRVKFTRAAAVRAAAVRAAAVRAAAVRAATRTAAPVRAAAAAVCECDHPGGGERTNKSPQPSPNPSSGPNPQWAEQPASRLKRSLRHLFARRHKRNQLHLVAHRRARRHIRQPSGVAIRIFGAADELTSLPFEHCAASGRSESYEGRVSPAKSSTLSSSRLDLT